MSGLAQILAEDLMVDWSRRSAPSIMRPPTPRSRTRCSTSAHRRQLEHPRLLRDAAQGGRHGARDADRRRSEEVARRPVRVPRQQRHRDRTTGRTLSRTLAAAAGREDAGAVRPAARGRRRPALHRQGRRPPRTSRRRSTAAIYGIDGVPDMVYAVVKHCPTLGGTLAATPALPARALGVVPLTVLAGTAAAPRPPAW